MKNQEFLNYYDSKKYLSDSKKFGVNIRDDEVEMTFALRCFLIVKGIENNYDDESSKILSDINMNKLTYGCNYLIENYI